MPTPEPKSLKLAVIPGDGIGPEVTAEGLKVLEQVTPADVSWDGSLGSWDIFRKVGAPTGDPFYPRRTMRRNFVLICRRGEAF